MALFTVIQTFRTSGKVISVKSYKTRQTALKHYRERSEPPVEGSKFVNTVADASGAILYSDLKQEHRLDPAAKWYHNFV